MGKISQIRKMFKLQRSLDDKKLKRAQNEFCKQFTLIFLQRKNSGFLSKKRIGRENDYVVIKENLRSLYSFRDQF